MKSFKKHLREEHQVTPETAAVIAKQLGVDLTSFTKEALAKGINMETVEHGGADPVTNITNNSLIMAARIAIAHLRENPSYYSLLVKAGL